MPEKSEVDKARGELYDLTQRRPSGSSTRGGRKLSGSISTARFSPESCEPSLWRVTASSVSSSIGSLLPGSRFT